MDLELLKDYLEIAYLIAAIMFVAGLKMLGNPKTARLGNLIAAGGMAIAILATIFMHRNEAGEPIGNYIWIFAAIIIGTIIGTLSAKKVQMTAMPQMVSLFNGMGGACAALISIVEFGHLQHGGEADTATLLTILAGLVIGTVSFSGSIIAFAKLQELMKKSFRLPAHHIINIVVLVVIFGLCGFMLWAEPHNSAIFYIIFILSLLYGIMFVVPIGGADMPVVISLLNSFTGLAAAFGGFLYDNQVMLTGGILVGSAGTLLTVTMCQAMNRSLSNVIFGSFGGGSTAADTSSSGGTIKPTTVSDSGILLNYAQKVIIIPGYGLAVAQAQHTIHEVESILESRGIEVKYAIHPVAGRMPGHMNVLLAEANVSYDKLVEMEQVNDEFATTDVVLVIGANDVVNPAARNNPASPIYGMPILNADKARTVIVLKRSMAAGYAGIDNELFGYPNCMMLFGDAKSTITKLVAELKEM